MKKFLLSFLLLALVAGGFYAISPLPAIHGIRNALREDDDAALSRHIDYPALRGNLRAQAEDYVARQAGSGIRGNALGAFAVEMAGRVAGNFVETMATPTGVRTLMAGRIAWRTGSGDGLSIDRPVSSEPPEDPFRGAHYRLESLSRFSATLETDELPVQVVLGRRGIDWKIVEINVGRHARGGNAPR